jgi:cysteine desulfurase / selenocysteine lyase
MDSTLIRNSFPIFTHQPDLVYLDSAATALKPTAVIEKEQAYYERFSSNIARGIYPLAEQATEAFEAARITVASFIGARPEEIIFTSGTTASLNLAADLLAPRVTRGDAIAVTALEHHSNFLPWKELCRKRNAELKVIPVAKTGDLNLAAIETLVNDRTKIIALGAISNVLGIINPIKNLVAQARSLNPNILVVIDAAQAVGHIPVDVTDWDADFVAFSGHKLFGPTGTGALYGKQSLLETLAPVSFGGGMVLDACAKEVLYKASPARFEAGTPNIAGVIGLGAAIDFINSIRVETIHAHENALALFACRRLKETFGASLQIVGDPAPEQKSGIVSLILDGIHPHDVAHLLGERNICVRAGLQCAAPLHEALNLAASTRLSLSIYNTEADIEKLITGLTDIRTIL